jgi:hypothetical protein
MNAREKNSYFTRKKTRPGVQRDDARARRPRAARVAGTVFIWYFWPV